MKVAMAAGAMTYSSTMAAAVMKPPSGPKAVVAKRYPPPALGSAEDSSASDIHMVKYKTVTMPSAPNEPAKISVPKGDPPADTVAQPLVIGDGPRVVAGQTVRVTYTGVTWRKPGTPFDYSGKQPQGYVEFPVGTGQLIKAWDEHIVGQTVGSRLVLVVPPKDGYGSTGNPDGSITGTDTLVFVIDILDAS